MIVRLSPTATWQLVAFVQLAAGLPASVMPTLPSGPAVAETAAVGVATNVAFTVAPAPAVKVQGFTSPVQAPPVQALSWLLGLPVAVIVIASPTSATQVVTLVQPASGSASVIVAAPLPLVAVVIDTVLAKLATSVLPLVPALNLHGDVVPLQAPPDQPVKRLPAPALAVIVIASPASAVQVVTFVQPASGSASVTVAAPEPPPAVAVAIVTVLAKLATSVSLLAPAVKVQGLAVPAQLPPSQPLKRAPAPLTGVIVIASPALATHEVTFEQPAAGLPSDRVEVPFAPATVVEIVTVLAKLAVSVSLFVGAVNRHGSVVPAQLPPDHPANRAPAPGTGVIVIASPTSATQVATPLQPASGLLSVIVALPPAPAALVIVTVRAKFAVSVSVLASVKVHGLLVPAQLPPDQPVKR